jgi:hypothetical protein
VSWDSQIGTVTAEIWALDVTAVKLQQLQRDGQVRH